MTNFELLTILQTIRGELDELDGFTGQIRALASKRNTLYELMTLVSSFDKSHSAYLSQLQNELLQFRTNITETSSLQFFRNSFALSEILKKLMIEIPSSEKIAGQLALALHNLQNAYDSFTRDHSTNRIFSLVLEAYSFAEKLDAFDAYVEFISQAISTDREPDEDAGTLAIYLPAALNLEEFIARLNALNEIYEELCRLMDVSVAERPLGIIKIESGSLWTKLFGDSRVIALMDDFLRGMARHVQRNYTDEGRSVKVSANIKTLDEILELSKKLQEQGIDVAQIQDELAKGTLIITKNINNLLENQALIVINGETVALSDNSAKKALGVRKVYRIEDDS